MKPVAPKKVETWCRGAAPGHSVSKIVEPDTPLYKTRGRVGDALEIIECVCRDCGTKRKTKLTPAGQLRTPTGWHKRETAVYCPNCWKEHYLLRAVAMPVAEPLGSSWEDLRKDLKVMWQQTTAASNWIMTELYTRDVRRNREAKMPPMPRAYLYPELRKEFPNLPPQSVSSIEQAGQKKYRAARYQVVWIRGAALPTYRYPTPFPVPNQSWSVRIEEGWPIVRIRIGDRCRELRLKSGPQFHRQYRAVRLIARGEAVPGEAAIYQHGNALMVKLVAWLPREPASNGAGASVLRVHTVKDALLVAVNLKDETLWTYNGDHLRRWSAEHRKRLQRWSEDQKYEQRPVPAFAQRREDAARKYRDRMNSATHEIAAQLASYADRRRFSAIQYDDTERGFCEGFPWYRLRALIEEKVGARGMQFDARGPVESQEPEPLKMEYS
jgi:hypothetical protein